VDRLKNSNGHDRGGRIEVIDLRSRKRASVIVDPQNLNGQPETPVVDREPESSPSVEIGSLFVKAQRFADETAKEAQRLADETAKEAERKAQEVILAAEAKAAEIIQRATGAEWVARANLVSDQAEEAMITGETGQQAGEIAPQTQPPIPPEAIATLSASIDEFAEASRTLAAELVKLRLTLSESSAPAPAGQHIHPDRIALTSNHPNGEAPLPERMVASPTS
jgi:hypothetical protein